GNEHRRLRVGRRKQVKTHRLEPLQRGVGVCERVGDLFRIDRAIVVEDDPVDLEYGLEVTGFRAVRDEREDLGGAKVLDGAADFVLLVSESDDHDTVVYVNAPGEVR